jgi:hypothetical protein
MTIRLTSERNDETAKRKEWNRELKRETGLKAKIKEKTSG